MMITEEKTTRQEIETLSEAARWRGHSSYGSRTPEEIAETRKRILALSPPPRPLPPGKTLEDVIVGQWPGDETDEEFQAILDSLKE